MERCFGVLKARFAILETMPAYDLKKQKYIALACTIYIFIRMYSRGDLLFIKYTDENIELKNIHRNVGASTSDRISIDVNPSQLGQMANI